MTFFHDFVPNYCKLIKMYFVLENQISKYYHICAINIYIMTTIPFFGIVIKIREKKWKRKNYQFYL